MVLNKLSKQSIDELMKILSKEDGDISLLASAANKLDQMGHFESAENIDDMIVDKIKKLDLKSRQHVRHIRQKFQL